MNGNDPIHTGVNPCVRLCAPYRGVFCFISAIGNRAKALSYDISPLQGIDGPLKGSNSIILHKSKTKYRKKHKHISAESQSKIIQIWPNAGIIFGKWVNMKNILYLCSEI